MLGADDTDTADQVLALLQAQDELNLRLFQRGRTLVPVRVVPAPELALGPESLKVLRRHVQTLERSMGHSEDEAPLHAGREDAIPRALRWYEERGSGNVRAVARVRGVRAIRLDREGLSLDEEHFPIEELGFFEIVSSFHGPTQTTQVTPLAMVHPPNPWPTSVLKGHGNPPILGRTMLAWPLVEQLNRVLRELRPQASPYRG